MADQSLRDIEAAATIEIVGERGSFLLIRAAGGLAVVERRSGRIYGMTAGEREGVAMTDEAISALLVREGCLPESEARRLFEELGDQGDRLARTLR